MAEKDQESIAMLAALCGCTFRRAAEVSPEGLLPEMLTRVKCRLKGVFLTQIIIFPTHNQVFFKAFKSIYSKLQAFRHSGWFW